MTLLVGYIVGAKGGYLAGYQDGIKAYNDYLLKMTIMPHLSVQENKPADVLQFIKPVDSETENNCE